MRARVKMIGAEKTLKTLIQLKSRTGKSAEEGMKIIALSSARLLAHSVQPYGTKSAKGKEITANTEKKVNAVWSGVNRGYLPETNDIRNATYAYRRGSGGSGTFKKSKDHPWVDRISESEKNIFLKNQIAKAGRAKAAWVAAANSLGINKISAMPKWIARHLSDGYGVSRVTGSDFTTQIELHNRTPYLSKIHLASDVQESIRKGRANGIKRMEHLIRQEIKKTKLGQ